MILTIDIGTTTIKAALMDPKGTIQKSCIHRLISTITQETATSNPRQYIECLTKILTQFDTKAIEAIIVSGNAPTLIPVTGEPTVKDGKLTLESEDARLWLDKRGNAFSQRVSELVGSYIDGSFYLPKALRIKEKEPALFERMTSFLTNTEYLTYLLTGNKVTILPADHLSQYYWNDAILSSLSLPSSLFPPFVTPGSIIGEVSEQARKVLGLPKKVKVIAGGPDFYLSILGSGVHRPGEICDRSGTSEGINLCIKQQVEEKGLMCYEHPANQELWNLSGIISTTGAAIDWGMKLLGLEKNAYNTFLSMAARSGETNLIFHPYLNGERAPIWDNDATATFSGLKLSTSRDEIARSILEGICFSILDVTRSMGNQRQSATKMFITDNHASFNFLSQMKSNVLQIEVADLKDNPVELTGLAMLASTSLGYYKNLTEASENCLTQSEILSPDPSKKDYYLHKFSQFKEIYKTTKASGIKL